MSCERDHTEIGDLVDGTLDGRARTALEAHLLTCASCRTLAADLGSIRQAARSLEPQVPAPGIWDSLASRVSAGGGARLGAWWPGWQAIGASAVTLALVVSLSWVGGRLAAGTAESGLVASSATRSIGNDLDFLDAQYTSTITGLETITSAERDALDPEMAGVLQTNLTLIDGAIVESRAALQTEPESDVARESLFEALRSKVELLQDMIALINEMRKGDPEGAARVASELTQ